MNKINVDKETILRIFVKSGTSNNTCKQHCNRLCRLMKNIFKEFPPSFEFILDVDKLANMITSCKYSYANKTQTYSNNSLINFFSTISIFAKCYDTLYNDSKFRECHLKWASRSKAMNKVENIRKLLFGMTTKLKNEIQSISYIEMANKVKNEWERHKYSKTKPNEYYITLGLASLMFRNAPRRTNTLTNLFFRDKVAPRTYPGNPIKIIYFVIKNHVGTYY